MTKAIDSKYLQAIDNRRQQAKIERPSNREVDAVADELVVIYSNPDYRGWYCKVVYELGSSKTQELVKRASTGKQPERLFSSLAKALMEQSHGKS